MSIRLSNTGTSSRLVRSSFNYSGDSIVIEHYVTPDGNLAPVYFNFRNQPPALVQGILPKTAQIGALVSEAMYFARIIVSLDKFSGMEASVGFALVVPNKDYRIGSVDTLPLSAVVPSTEHLSNHILGQVMSVFREWSDEESYWDCINNWLKEQGLLKTSAEVL